MESKTALKQEKKYALVDFDDSSTQSQLTFGQIENLLKDWGVDSDDNNITIIELGSGKQFEVSVKKQFILKPKTKTNEC